MLNWKANAVKEELLKSFGPGYEIQVVEPLKTNGTRPTGIQILKEGANVAPVFYLSEGDDRSPEELASILYQEYMSRTADMQYVEQMGAKLLHEVDPSAFFYSIREVERNMELLEDRPYETLENGFVKLYFYRVDENSRVSVTDELMKQMGIDMETVKAYSEENTPKMFPAAILTMEQMMAEIMGVEIDSEMMPDDAPELYVITNEQRLDGAGCLYYEGMLETISEQLGGDFYVLPSSLHEQLLVPVGEDTDPIMLEAMVREINATTVAPEDRLSDRVLFYDSREKSLTVPKEPELEKQREKEEPGMGFHM